MCETRSRELSSEIRSLIDEVMSLRSELSGIQVLFLHGKLKKSQAQQTNKDFTIPWSKVISCGVSGGTIMTASLVTTVSVMSPGCSNKSR